MKIYMKRKKCKIEIFYKPLEKVINLYDDYSTTVSEAKPKVKRTGN